VPPLIEPVTRPDGTRGLKYHFHAGQRKAWASEKRIVAVIAGARAGKTSWGPCWLHREMMRKGPGDYLVAAPSFPLLDKAAAPEVEFLLARTLQLGKLRRAPLRFDFSEQGCIDLWGRVPDRQPRILFGHADDPDSLEAMTLKAAWLDEVGQARFKLGSWEAVQRRLSIDRGRCLLTSTPYNLGWLKQQVHDPWLAANRDHPEIDLFRFPSTANPAFPPEEFERARKSLPAWRFALFYLGQFTRPAGQIYDSFDPTRHVVPRFKVPAEWPRFVGLDFGPVNTAAVFLAEEQAPVTREPTGRLILYRTYHPGKRDPAEHVRAVLENEPRLPRCVGGAASEDEWREKFAAAGLPVLEPPVRDVEVGIDTVYAAFARNEILVFSDLAEFLDQVQSYSRVVDDRGDVTEKIEAKETFHLLDALRYGVVDLRRPGGGPWEAAEPGPGDRGLFAEPPEGLFDAGGSFADAPW
jgi:hypothetical protein